MAIITMNERNVKSINDKNVLLWKKAKARKGFRINVGIVTDFSRHLNKRKTKKKKKCSPQHIQWDSKPRKPHLTCVSTWLKGIHNNDQDMREKNKINHSTNMPRNSRWPWDSSGLHDDEDEFHDTPTALPRFLFLVCIFLSSYFFYYYYLLLGSRVPKQRQGKLRWRRGGEDGGEDGGGRVIR